MDWLLLLPSEQYKVLPVVVLTKNSIPFTSTTSIKIPFLKRVPGEELQINYSVKLKRIRKERLFYIPNITRRRRLKMTKMEEEKKRGGKTALSWPWRPFYSGGALAAPRAGQAALSPPPCPGFPFAPNPNRPHGRSPPAPLLPGSPCRAVLVRDATRTQRAGCARL
jgi:hypothetical protein